MNRLEIILSASLLLSIVFNVGLIAYTRAAVIKLLSVSEELGDLSGMIDSFTRHLDDIYSLEMFYGDDVIRGLIEHATSFNELMETFEHIYILTEAERLEPEDADAVDEETDDDTNDQTP
jgi:hypothetical protein|tara:strand:- start:2586 stop:2945 length:360 start_codon:yes stop_codon:yes gene_type:complete